MGEGAIAVLARPWVLEGAVGTRLEAALREPLPGYCETMLQARVALPGEPGDGAEALRLAFRRLAARAAGHHRLPEAQVRDVLLQLLTERAEQGCAIRRTAVVANAVAIARRMHFERGGLEQLIRAAELQDVGLVGLGTDGPLTAAERSRIREHPLLAQRIVGAAPSLVRAAAIIRSCYERYDGTGYPDGLSGEQIPRSARVISVCVAFHAMTSPRPYRPAITESEALDELVRCSGSHFDPAVVATFADVVMPGVGSPRDPAASPSPG